ncbi:hypothetical protein ATANTOWER_032511 [Ataeniobius toweri]|uniref:Uncharacterized protein n=1 Tax=Ataeniobius toweri TaxID=208326 RepID=A0ABU7BTI5_9TELE|nr:hypothetical protein [Ataeniobius toweri]
MGSGGKDRPAVCLAAAVFLMCYLVQLTDCLGLRKTQIRVVKREADFTLAAGVQEGKIVFGKVFEFPDGNKKQSSNASVDDESDYQADFTGWSRHTDVDEASKEKWNNLETSLHCFGDHMKFRSLGPQASQLAVVQANDSPMPLSMVPPRCGYRMHGNLMAFVMIAPYEGCNMIQQGGNYMLPLLWQGHPLSLLCPAPGVPQQASPQVPQQASPQVPQQASPQVPQQASPQVPQQASPQVPHQAFFDFYSFLQAAAEPVKPVHFPSYPFPYPHPTAPPSTPVSKDPYPYIPYPHPTAPPSTPVSKDPYPYIPYPYPTAPPSTPVSKDPYPYIPYPYPTAPPSTPVSKDPYPYIPYPYPTAPPSTPVSKDPYPYIPYPYPTAPPSTPVPKDPYPQIPFDPRLPWLYWLQVPEFPLLFPYPPEYPMSGPKASKTNCAATKAPPGTPAQCHPMDYLPFLPKGQFPYLFYPQQG